MSLRDVYERFTRLLFYDDVAPGAIEKMGFREAKMWSRLSELKLSVKYPQVERWG